MNYRRSNSSSNHSDDTFEKLPSMDFEPTLLVPRIGETDGRAIQIPICIGALLVSLRELHEIELRNGRSFLNDFGWSNSFVPPNLEKDIDDLADWLLTQSVSYEECRKYLLTKSPRLLLETLMKILGRTSKSLYPLSDKTCRALHHVFLLEPVQPYQMYVKEIMYEKIAGAQNDNEDNSSDVAKFIQEYFSSSGGSRTDRLKSMNLINELLFIDLRRIKKSRTRNLIRFIIRGITFLMRRYVLAVCTKSIKLREESWPTNCVTLRPHIKEYIILTLAERMGPLIFSFTKSTPHTRKMAVRAMVNILCCNTDRLWIPGQTPAGIHIETALPTCHPGCICLNLE